MKDPLLSIKRAALDGQRRLFRPLWIGLLLQIVPWVVLVIWCWLLIRPETRESAISWMSRDREHRPVELLTAAFFAAAGVRAVQMAMRFRSRPDLTGLPMVAMAAFAILALGTTMEEISWGQHLFGFETPSFLKVRNSQDEITLHNLQGAHGNEGKLYLLFCAGAFLGMLRRMPLLPEADWAAVRVPPVLISFTLAILLISIAKLVIESVPVSGDFRIIVRWNTELGELYIAAWSTLYAMSRRS